MVPAARPRWAALRNDREQRADRDAYPRNAASAEDGARGSRCRRRGPVSRSIADAAIECRAEDELIIRLVLDDVAQASQLFALTEVCKRLREVIGGDGRPADNALDPRAASRVSPSANPRSQWVSSRLWHACTAMVPEIPAESSSGFRSCVRKSRRNRTHMLVDPAILVWHVTPKVMMGVDAMRDVAGALHVLSHVQFRLYRCTRERPAQDPTIVQTNLAELRVNRFKWRIWQTFSKAGSILNRAEGHSYR